MLLNLPDLQMNRKKKIKQILTKKLKKSKAKLAPKSSKPRYVAKADRDQTDTPAVNSSSDGSAT